MEKFKIAMGFPMLATVVWLFNVAAGDYGANVFWLGVFLVLVAFAAWIFGEFVQRGRDRQRRGARHRFDVGRSAAMFLPWKTNCIGARRWPTRVTGLAESIAGRH